MWKYYEANLKSINDSISQFPWYEQFDRFIDDPTSQVELLNETILNIMSNFVPNKVVTVKPSEPEWLSKKIKGMLRKQNRCYKRYKMDGFRDVDRIPLETPRIPPILIADKFVTCCKEKAIFFNNFFVSQYQP